MDRYKRIRDLREDKDMTQAQVAAVLGVSSRAYSYYENGQRTLTPQLLCDLAALYGVSVDYLLERTNTPKPYPPAKD